MEQYIEILKELEKTKIWDEEPIFCFTSDIDWASEYVLELFFDDIKSWNVPFTLFLTHPSKVISDHFDDPNFEFGIHPNFLPGSSHGEGLQEIIEACLEFTPKTQAFRAHRYYTVNDIEDMLFSKYGFKYSSNLPYLLTPKLRPRIHRSGLVHIPLFFEDGGHIYNKFENRLDPYLPWFKTPGLKIINIHPMNYAVNPAEFTYMRSIKDRLSREEYVKMDKAAIEKVRNNQRGITDVINEVAELASQYKVMSLDEIYRVTIGQ